METIARHQLVVAVIGATIALFVGMPTLLTYIGTWRKNTRQNRIRDVLLKFGPSLTGDFMFRCQKLSQDQRDKAIKEMERDGEIYSHSEASGLTRWYFKPDRDPQSHTQRRRG
jgi:hypothetical protein